MRIFIFVLAAIVPTCEIDRARAADKPPAFDIVRNCKAEAAGSIAGDAGASCKREETEAKNEVTNRWSQFGASQKRSCIGESSTGGDQSYVELLTCLEWAAAASSGDKNNRLKAGAHVSLAPNSGVRGDIPGSPLWVESRCGAVAVG